MTYTKNNKFATPLQGCVEIGGRMVSNPTEQMLIDDGWTPYTAPERTVEQIRQDKLNALDAFDNSPEINGWKIDGELQDWLTPNDRANYLNTLLSAQRMGLQSIIFLGHTVTVETGINIIDTLNLYAMQTVTVTDTHKAAIKAITTKDEIAAYDYTTGYPTMPDFTI